MEKNLLDMIEVLNKMPDSDLIKTVDELENLLSFKAPTWEKHHVSKKDYATAIMIIIEKITKKKSVSEASQNISDIFTYSQTHAPGTYQLIFSKFKLIFNPFNFQTRKN